MGKLKYIDYNWKKIGERMRKEREAFGFSQSKLMEEIGRSPDSYRVLGRWEKGKVEPQLTDMLALCDVFQCDIGYLLGEQSTKRHIAADFQEITGLNEKTIEILSKWSQTNNNNIKIINTLINNPYGRAVLASIGEYLEFTPSSLPIGEYYRFPDKDTRISVYHLGEDINSETDDHGMTLNMGNFEQLILNKITSYLKDVKTRTEAGNILPISKKYEREHKKWVRDFKENKVTKDEFNEWYSSIKDKEYKILQRLIDANLI